MNRKEILETAITTVCKERQDAYGNCEDNFSLIAKLWSDYTETDITAKDVAMMMILLKMARIKTGNYKSDNYVDIAGYAACGGEVAASLPKVAANLHKVAAEVGTKAKETETEQTEPKAERKRHTVTDKPKKPRGGQALSLDIGKIKALREGGWTLAKIADEMRVAPQTIANHLARAEAENAESKTKETKTGNIESVRSEQAEAGSH